jgi:DNA replication protein DnaC
MSLFDLWKHFKFLKNYQDIPDEHLSFFQSFLQEEFFLKEQKRIQFLLRYSGIKRVKKISDFDWAFNPKIPKDKIMEFLHSNSIKHYKNLLIIGPAGVGKSHIASALCYEAILASNQTFFISFFDLMAKLAKSKNLFSLIDYYARLPLLCIDELGYAIPSQEQADWFFQIISKRSEVYSTIITTNLIPSQWGKIFDSITASAILDRLSLNGIFLTFEGRSYRSKK